MTSSSPRTTTSTPTDDDGPSRRQLAADRLAKSVNELLEQRDDLHGVHPMADLLHDAVRWTA